MFFKHPLTQKHGYWGLSLGLILGLAPSALAAYTPPKMPTAPSDSRRTTTGTRGGSCTGTTPTALTALAPHQHVGQTHSSHPTFAWFVPDQSPLPLEFQLYRLNKQGTLQPVHRTQLLSNQGFMSLVLPKTHPGLRLGHRYLWQVIVMCNPEHPSTALVAAAEIERVALPSSLATALAAQTAPLNPASPWAEAGFWYDALAAITQTPPGLRGSAFTTTLLQAVADLELRTAPPQGSAQGQRLQHIIDAMGATPKASSQSK